MELHDHAKSYGMEEGQEGSGSSPSSLFSDIIDKYKKLSAEVIRTMTRFAVKAFLEKLSPYHQIR